MRPAELVEMAFVARQFYLEGKTRVAIADSLGTTRFRVARMLELARETGLVTITVNRPGVVNTSLSDRLADRFGLRRGLAAVTASDQPMFIRDALGRVAAGLLTDIVTADDVLGFASGRTLNTIVTHLRSLAACDIVQLTGLAGGIDETSSELVRQVSAISGGRAYPIYAPLIASDRVAADAFIRQGSISAAYERFARVTKAVVAVGSWDPPESQLADSLTAEERERFVDRGVRAEVSASLLTTEGDQVFGLEERALAISLDQLRQIPEVIVVAGGSHKTEALLAVLRTGIVHTLVTDNRMAERLLDATASA